MGKGLRLRLRFVKGGGQIEDNPSWTRPRSTPRQPSPAAPASGRSSIFWPRASSASSQPILHPASIFLDMSGEEIRGRLFLTADPSGEELCLRPEYTIPVCRAYLASDKAGASGRIFLPRTGLPRPGRGQRRTHPDRPRKLRPQGRRGGRRRDLRAVDGGGGGGGRTARGATRRRRPVRRLLTALALPDVWRRRLQPRRSRKGATSPPFSMGAAERARPARRAGRAWKAPTTPGPRRWSRICWRSRASTPSAAAPQARSPTGSSSRPPSARASAIGTEKRQVLERLSRRIRRSGRRG